jgi:hypothetical protein
MVILTLHFDHLIGRNSLPASRYHFDISFSNIGFGLHPGYARQVARFVGAHYRAWYIHVRDIAFLPRITQVHVNQQEERH